MMLGFNRPGAVAAVVASGLGLLIAVVDVTAPFGDDSSMVTVFLWLLTSGLLGFVMPRSPWRWSVLVGPWLPLTQLLVHDLRLPVSIYRNTYATSLILVPFSLAVCCVGAYGGALTRRLVVPPDLP